MKPPARIRLRLLGRLALAYSDDPAPIRLSTRKAGALLTYLAMRPDETASREELATLLWGSCSDQQARQSLRQALALLRKELRWSHFFTADADVVRLQGGFWSVDARDFEELSKSSDPAALDQAARLFGGEFLTGLNIEEEGFEEWLRDQRQRTQLAAARLCETFAARPDLVADGELAVGTTERLLALDPLREDWQRLALTLYARYRGKTEALAQAETFAGLLKRELGVAPEKETRALVERIRNDEIAFAETPRADRSVEPKTAPTDAALSTSILPIEDAEPAVAPLVARSSRFIPSRGRVIAFGSAIAAVVLVSAFAANQFRDTPKPAEVEQLAATNPWQSPATPAVGRTQGVVTIAVLPFAVRGASSEASRTIADVMTDDLTYVLSRSNDLRVISHLTMRRYRDQPADDQALKTELQVRYLLKGSIDAGADALRVSIALVDATAKRNVWTANFERVGADRNTIQDEIVIGLGRELRVEVTRNEGSFTPEPPDVHAMIFRGYHALADSATSGLSALKLAEQNLSAALERDPDNLRAQVGLGAYHVRMAVQLFAPDPAPHLAAAEKLLQGVLERQPTNSTAQVEMGLLQIARGQGRLARPFFEKAIELNPSEAQAYAQLGRNLAGEGRAAEGLERVLYAMRLSPRDPAMASWLGFAGAAELELGHHEKAIEFLNRAIALHPTQPRNRLVLIAAHAIAGNLDTARIRLTELQKTLPHLSGEKLIQRFFNNNIGTRFPRLREGLQIAVEASVDPWQSPRAPSQAADASPPRQTRLVPILVLPFKAYGESSVQTLADMMTDDLINMLSRIQAFRVISRQTARSYQGQSIDVAAVGTELQVRYILDGSMRMHGDKLRVNIELIDPATKLSAWTGQIERDSADRSGVQDEIIARVARELNLEMPHIEGERRAGDQDSVALTYKGWAAMNAAYARSSPDAFKQAKAYFQQALARDPQHIPAEIGLAAYHANMGAQVLDGESRGHRGKAREILRGVIDRAPQNSAAHHFLGLVGGATDAPEERLKSFERSVELNPSNAGGHAHIGHALSQMGRPSEGLEHVRYAIRLSPRDPNLGYWMEFLGSAELRLNHHSEAIENFRRSTELNPGYPRGWAGLAAANALSGNMDEARKHADKLKTFVPQLSAEMVAERFSRRREQPLYEGLRLALALPDQPSPPAPPPRADRAPNEAPKSASAQDPWQSPPLTSRPANGAPAGPIIALAVLPFTAVGETAGSIQSIADMLTDDLTNALSRVAKLRVISRHTARSYQAQRTDVATIGSELQVRYVLEGSVRMHGGKLRVNVELIDPATRLPAWSTRIERDSAESHTVQDEIVGRLARELHFEIYKTESERASKDPSVSELIYVGWTAILTHGTSGMDSLRRAEQAFMQVLAREPDNRDGIAGLGAYHVLIGSLQLVADWSEHLAKGESLLRKSIHERPGSSSQYFYLSIAQRMRRQLPEALDSLEHCLEIAPSQAPCHAHTGHTLVQLGRASEGIQHINYALRLSPRDMSRPHWLRFAGEAEIELGHFDRALDLLRQSHTQNPRQPRTLRSLAAASALAGQVDEARKYLDELQSVAPHIGPERALKRSPIEDWQPQLSRGLKLAVMPPKT